MTEPDLTPETPADDADPLADRSNIVEGLTGRLPLLVGGLMLFLSCGLMFGLRNLFHRNSNTITFDDVSTWGPLFLAAILIVAPLLHTAAHAVALAAMGLPQRWSRAGVYPRVRPAAPVSRRQAVRFFAAPFILAALLAALVVIKPVSVFAAVVGGVNLAIAAADAWKILGLQRFPAKTTFEVHADHCRALNAGR
ncbi:MAG TPA: metalloprotease family protein [Herpetosiphonaceae bacterium]